MNENEKSGANRRRSSRRRGNRSGNRAKEARRPDDSPRGESDRAESSPRQSERSRSQASDRDEKPDFVERLKAERERAEKNNSQERRPGWSESQRRNGGRQDNAGVDRAKGRGLYSERSRWSAPRSSAPVLPRPVCHRCGKPIEDLASAVNDRDSGDPIHFDCVLSRIAESESLQDGDKIIYIGGGRFGIVHFDAPGDLKHFEIKKIVQWEEKDKRSLWRKEVADLYSTT